jgi:hypothetical protein
MLDGALEVRKYGAKKASFRWLEGYSGLFT